MGHLIRSSLFQLRFRYWIGQTASIYYVYQCWINSEACKATTAGPTQRWKRNSWEKRLSRGFHWNLRMGGIRTVVQRWRIWMIIILNEDNLLPVMLQTKRIATRDIETCSIVAVCQCDDIDGHLSVGDQIVSTYRYYDRK